MSTTNLDSVPEGDNARWTRLNITLHWLIVGLLIAQFFESEWMEKLFDATLDGEVAAGTTVLLGYSHMIIGGLIFLAIALRLWDRRTQGRPAHPAAKPTWAIRLAGISHAALYVLPAQILSARWSQELGLPVDDPFQGRNLTRVVTGVTLYDYVPA